MRIRSKIGSHSQNRSSILKVALFLVVFAGVILSQQTATFSVSPSKANDESEITGRKVVIVSMPRVTWDLLDVADTPNIDKLVEDGSIANLSIRTAQAERSLEKGYASLSAGDRAIAVSSDRSTFFAADETIKGKPARDIYKWEQGVYPDDVDAFSVGFELTRQRNASSLTSSEVGAFADSLNSNGRSIGVFGNADSCANDVMSCRQRSVAYLGSDKNGLVRYGDISRRILNSDMSLNMKLVKEKSLVSIKKNDVTAVECSDLERIDRERKSSDSSVVSSRFSKAINQCDDLIGSLVKGLDLSKDRILIVSPVSPQSTEQLTVFIASGKGIEPGFAVSGITRRGGIVALADVAPSVLTFLGVDPPESMVTTLMDFQKSDENANDRVDRLVHENDGALVRDNSFSLIATIFIFTSFFGAIVGLLSYKKIKSLRIVAKFLLLMSLSMPSITFLMLPFMTSIRESTNIAIVFVLFAITTSILGYLCGEKWGYCYVVLSISVFTLLLQLGDVITGGNLQLNSLFGYSAIVAGRFSGFGNLTFSIVAVSSLLIVAVVKELGATKPAWDKKWINYALMAMLILVLIIDGSPYFGSDVGGVLALTPTIFLVGLMLFGKRISWKSAIVAVIATLGAITAFSLFDLNRPASERSHLGRFVEVMLEGKAGIVIERKVLSNFNILTNAPIASLVIIGTLFALFLFLYPERYVKKNSVSHPFFRYIAYPGFLIGLLGMLLNDSGIAIPGMIISFAFPAVILMIFEINPVSESNTTSESVSV